MTLNINTSTLSALAVFDTDRLHVPCSGSAAFTCADSVQLVDPSIPSEYIAGRRVSAPSLGALDAPATQKKHARHVSFSARDTVFQLPSNTAIGRIAAARNKTKGAADSSGSDDDTDVALIRQAQAMLPHGASAELLGHPGLAMTSLYVRSGHIHSIGDGRSRGGRRRSATVDERGDGGGHVHGVLKPYLPPLIDWQRLDGEMVELDEGDEESPAGPKKIRGGKGRKRRGGSQGKRSGKPRNA